MSFDNCIAGLCVTTSARMSRAETYSSRTGRYGHSGAFSRQARLQRIDLLSQLFDTAFAVPGTNIRFGVEAGLRLIPVVGDVAASALSAYLLYEAYQLGVPRSVMARLIANVAVEGAVGAVPILGDMFDVAFRANRRNARILREHFARESRR
jgi:hypothetical protein